MYFFIGLCMLAAAMVAANIVFTTTARLASFAFAAGKAGYDAIRARCAHRERIYHYPSSVMATSIRPKRDWEKESRWVRQQVLLEGPRIWRNPSPVLKQIDWDIAIELKKTGTGPPQNRNGTDRPAAGQGGSPGHAKEKQVSQTADGYPPG